MRIKLLSITHKIPEWVKAGYTDYAKRLPPCFLELIELPAEKRTRIDVNRIKEIEGKKLLSAIKTQDGVIALDVKGKSFSTEQLAEDITKWQIRGRNINFLIGGPDGLSGECLEKAHEIWSLSSLTFPHFLVRLIMVEQLYRAWTIVHGHPYHR